MKIELERRGNSEIKVSFEQSSLYAASLNLASAKYHVKSEHYQSYALANPGAVMIKFFHTVIAYGTMRAARRSIKHAGITILYLHNNSINNHILRARPT